MEIAHPVYVTEEERTKLNEISRQTKEVIYKKILLLLDELNGEEKEIWQTNIVVEKLPKQNATPKHKYISMYRDLKAVVESNQTDTVSEFEKIPEDE